MGCRRRPAEEDKQEGRSELVEKGHLICFPKRCSPLLGALWSACCIFAFVFLSLSDNVRRTTESVAGPMRVLVLMRKPLMSGELGGARQNRSRTYLGGLKWLNKSQRLN